MGSAVFRQCSIGEKSSNGDNGDRTQGPSGIREGFRSRFSAGDAVGRRTRRKCRSSRSISRPSQSNAVSTSTHRSPTPAFVDNNHISRRSRSVEKSSRLLSQTICDHRFTRFVVRCVLPTSSGPLSIHRSSQSLEIVPIDRSQVVRR